MSGSSENKRELNPNKVGIRIYCAVCRRMKKPFGRSAPLGLSMCEFGECRAYEEEPQVGDLWPGESEAEFGYPSRNEGTELRNG